MGSAKTSPPARIVRGSGGPPEWLVGPFDEAHSLGIPADTDELICVGITPGQQEQPFRFRCCGCPG
jgi:hypothetical protein